VAADVVVLRHREVGGSFEEFFDREYVRLGKALFLLTASSSEAEDLAQESMARIFERWDRVGRMESPSAYAYRVALNVHKRRSRGLWRRADIASLPFELRSKEKADTTAQVLDALQRLTVEQRQAVVLVEWMGFSPEECGRILRIKAESVRVRLHRARVALRDGSEADDE